MIRLLILVTILFVIGVALAYGLAAILKANRPPREMDELDRQMYRDALQLERQAKTAHLSGQKQYGKLLSKEAKELRREVRRR